MARASLLTGKHKPLYMMEGLDARFDAIFFLGYHGSIGASQAMLSHSYNPRAIWEARINGEIVGETALNALVAAHYGVPIALVTGDQVTADRGAAVCMPAPALRRGQALDLALRRREPASRGRACAHSRGRAPRADSGEARHGPTFAAPIQIELTFLTADMAEMSAWLRGVRLVEGQSRTVRLRATTRSTSSAPSSPSSC